MNVKLIWTLVTAAAALQAAPPRRANWELRQFNWVKLVDQEKGAEPSAHPVRVNPSGLRALLAKVQVLPGGEYLFSREDLDRFQGPLAEALGLAAPGEDVVVFCTSRKDGGFLAPEMTLTARMFAKGDRLHLIVGETRLEFAGPARAHVGPPLPGYGSRTQPGQAALKAEGAQVLRPDWIAFPVAEAAKGPDPAPAPAAAPVAAPAPAPDPQVRSVPLAVKPPKGSAEERLRTLNRLREEKLVSEEEYQRKRKEILDGI